MYFALNGNLEDAHSTSQVKPLTLSCKHLPIPFLVDSHTHRAIGLSVMGSFSNISDDIVIHCLAPFFIFEHSCDPEREAQAQDGHRLLLLRKWSKEQTAAIKGKMERISPVPRGNKRAERTEFTYRVYHRISRKQSWCEWLIWRAPPMEWVCVEAWMRRTPMHEFDKALDRWVMIPQIPRWGKTI